MTHWIKDVSKPPPPNSEYILSFKSNFVRRLMSRRAFNGNGKSIPYSCRESRLKVISLDKRLILEYAQVGEYFPITSRLFL